MPWLSRNDRDPTEKLHSDDLNNLANDVRQWGGDVNGGGHHLYNVILNGGSGGSGGAVSSVFGRQGAVVAQSGDYSAAQVTNAVDRSQTYADPVWITSLSWSKIGGAPATGVSSVFGRSGAVVPQSGDYTPAQVGAPPVARQIIAGTGLSGGGDLSADRTLAVVPDTTVQRLNIQSGAAPVGGRANLNFIPGTNVTLTVADNAANNRIDVTIAAISSTAPVASVFGRLGAVVATSGDYSASQVTNAVDSSLSYPNPAWISSLAWSKLTGVPTILIDPTTTRGDILVRSANALARHGIGTDGQVLTADSSQANGVRWAAATGGMSDPTTTLGDLIVRGSSGTTRLPVGGTNGQVLTVDSAQTLGVKWAAVVGGVSSVFTRTGAVVAANGDYTAAQVTNAVDSTQSYPNPSWIASLAWSKITGVPATGVSSVFTRTGAVVAQAGDYTAAQITNAVSTAGSYADPAWITSLSWGKLTGVPATGVSSVFGRSGAVVAQAGDYAAAQITNAADMTGSYANPAWISSLAWGKITGAPSIVNTLNTLSGAIALVAGTNITLTPSGQNITIAASGGGGTPGGSSGQYQYNNAGAFAGGNIYASGSNVGIGTSSATSVLDVAQTVSPRLNVTFTNTVAAAVNNRMRLRLGPHGGFVGTDLHPYIEAIDDTGTLAGLAFGVYNGTSIEAMRITSAGLVGIATASPASGLEVNAFARISGQTNTPSTGVGLEMYWNGSQAVVQAYNRSTPAYQPLYFSASPMALMNGNVGVNSTNPLARMQVVTSNDTAVNTVTAWDARHFMVGQDANTGGVGISYNNTSGFGVIQALAPAVAWKNLVLQSGGGFVGIGTTTNAPLYRLQISGFSAAAPQLNLSYDGTDNGLYLMAYPNAAHFTQGIAFNGSWIAKNANYTLCSLLGGIFQVVCGSGTVGAAQTLPVPTIYAVNGTVGINTTSPLAGLFIDTGTGGSSVKIATYASGGIAYGIGIAASTLTFGAGIGPTGAFQMGLTTSGYLGLGVGGAPNINYQLHLSADSAAKPSTNYWISLSDIRLKTDVRPFTDGLKQVLQVKPIRYRYNGKLKTPTDGECIGVDAQAHKDILPDCVGSIHADLEGDGKPVEVFDFNPQGLFYAMLNAIKELAARLEKLEAGA